MQKPVAAHASPSVVHFLLMLSSTSQCSSPPSTADNAGTITYTVFIQSTRRQTSLKLLQTFHFRFFTSHCSTQPVKVPKQASRRSNWHYTTLAPPSSSSPTTLASTGHVVLTPHPSHFPFFCHTPSARTVASAPPIQYSWQCSPEPEQLTCCLPLQIASFTPFLDAVLHQPVQQSAGPLPALRCCWHGGQRLLLKEAQLAVRQQGHHEDFAQGIDCLQAGAAGDHGSVMQVVRGSVTQVACTTRRHGPVQHLELLKMCISGAYDGGQRHHS